MKLFVGAKAVVHYNGKVLLVREASSYAEGTEVGRWDVVGGRIEPQEKLHDGLEREVFEESGLSIQIDKLLNVYEGFPLIKGEKCHVVRIYFLCEANSDKVTLSQDHDAYDWVDPNDWGNKELMNDIEEMLIAARDLV